MRFIPLAFPAIVLASASPLSAHHGGGTFDLTKSVTYNGTLAKVELVHPHSWLYFRRQGGQRQSIAPPMRDAIGPCPAPVGMGQGTVSDWRADHRRGRA